MTTIGYVLNIFYGLLTVTPRHKHKAPDGITQGTYTVINSLGVPVNPIQTAEVNVNLYAKDADVAKGIPNLAVLETMQQQAHTDLHNKSNAEYDIEFERALLFREEATQRHYINMRFRIIFLNN